MDIILVCGPVPNGTLDIGLRSRGLCSQVSHLSFQTFRMVLRNGHFLCRGLFCRLTGSNFPVDSLKPHSNPSNHPKNWVYNWVYN